LLVLSPLVLVALVACGPSFQAIYDSDVHFEHCYALDETSTPQPSKKECWSQWLRSYTYGQSRDRVDFAASRVAALSVATNLAVDPMQTHAVSAAPLPTSAFAPPPNIIVDAGAPASEAGAATSNPPVSTSHRQTPGSDCADACEARWTSCRNGCSDGTCDNCDRAYRACMPPCFRDEPMSHDQTRTLR
jgi:hypothetical protein